MEKLSYENIVDCKEMAHYLEKFIQISPIMKRFHHIGLKEEKELRILAVKEFNLKTKKEIEPNQLSRVIYNQPDGPYIKETISKAEIIELPNYCHMIYCPSCMEDELIKKQIENNSIANFKDPTGYFCEGLVTQDNSVEYWINILRNRLGMGLWCNLKVPFLTYVVINFFNTKAHPIEICLPEGSNYQDLNFLDFMEHVVFCKEVLGDKIYDYGNFGTSKYMCPTLTDDLINVNYIFKVLSQKQFESLNRKSKLNYLYCVNTLFRDFIDVDNSCNYLEQISKLELALNSKEI